MDPFSLDHFLDWALSPLPTGLVPTAISPQQPPQPRGTAFTSYPQLESDLRLLSIPQRRDRTDANIHRRAIGLLRRIRDANKELTSEAQQRSRGFRHMMRERERRERLSQRYSDLRSELRPLLKTKGDKVSIVQSASSYVRELKGVKEAMERRNKELEAAMASTTGVEEVMRLDEVKVVNTSSVVDSMIGALTCLKGMDVKARNILLYVAADGSEFSGVVGVQNKVRCAYI